MDGGFDLSSLLSSAEGSDAISRAMDILMKKPELIDTIANELGMSSGGKNAGDGSRSDTEETAAKKTDVPVKNEKNRDRERLLLALKPYLNEKRRGAIDMMVNLGSLGGIIEKLDPNILKAIMGGSRNV